jgi:hypothetical protein
MSVRAPHRPRCKPPPSLPDLLPLRWAAHDFVLVRATPTGTGSRYETVQRFHLLPEK